MASFRKIVDFALTDFHRSLKIFTLIKSGFIFFTLRLFSINYMVIDTIQACLKSNTRQNDDSSDKFLSVQKILL